MNGWVELFTAIGELLPVLSEKKRAETEHVERTLLALNDAYYVTKRYFAGLEAGAEPTREKQFEVAHKWDAVSYLVRRYDANLANRLGLKSRFWREGGAWSREQREQARIGLEQVRQDGRFLLLRKLPKI